MKDGREEQVVQRFPNRCPYCDNEVSYEGINLKTGENEVVCPVCQRTYIKVIFDESNSLSSNRRERGDG